MGKVYNVPLDINQILVLRSSLRSENIRVKRLANSSNIQNKTLKDMYKKDITTNNDIIDQLEKVIYGLLT